ELGIESHVADPFIHARLAEILEPTLGAFHAVQLSVRTILVPNHGRFGAADHSERSMHFDPTVEARREVGERQRIQRNIASAHRCHADAGFGQPDNAGAAHLTRALIAEHTDAKRRLCPKSVAADRLTMECMFLRAVARPACGPLRAPAVHPVPADGCAKHAVLAVRISAYARHT